MLIRDYWIGATCVLLNYTALFLIKELVGQPLTIAPDGTADAGTYRGGGAGADRAGAMPFNVHTLPTAAALAAARDE